MITTIFSAPPHPYYIVTPPYIQSSAGIRCLHILCHALNKRGHSAYIVVDPASHGYGAQLVGGPDLLTPILTPKITEAHTCKNQIPIVVYPEIVKGNPYNAEVVVRYILNYPGHLGGDEAYDSDELCFGYSLSLAEHARTENVLFIPAVDTSIFKPPSVETPRNGSCFYADKYRKVHGGSLYVTTEASFEITRQQDGELTPYEIAKIFQTSELFYTYENTALAIEAVLCGCPAVFIPNPHLDGIIAANEIGMDGYAWGTDPAEISRAKATVERGATNYFRNVENFWMQIDNFVEKTQESAKTRTAIKIKNARKVDVFGYLEEMNKVRAVEENIYHQENFLESSVELYPNLIFAFFASVFRIFPPLVEREVSKLISTLGFRKIGGYIWNSSFYRRRAKIVVTVDAASIHKAHGTTSTLYPPAA